VSLFAAKHINHPQHIVIHRKTTDSVKFISSSHHFAKMTNCYLRGGFSFLTDALENELFYTCMTSLLGCFPTNLSQADSGNSSKYRKFTFAT